MLLVEAAGRLGIISRSVLPLTSSVLWRVVLLAGNGRFLADLGATVEAWAVGLAITVAVAREVLSEAGFSPDTVTLAVAISMVISRNKFGLALRAIKQDEDAAAHLGVNPYTAKLKVHAIAAALVGIAGGIYARRAAFFYPGDVFAFQTGISILLMPVIGGIGTVWGPVLGGVIFGTV